MEVGDMEEKIKTGIPGVVYCKVEAVDGCSGKYHATVVSDHFKGQTLLAQQRAVFKVLEEEMKTIHALTMKCYTVEKWEAQSAVMA